METEKRYHLVFFSYFVKYFFGAKILFILTELLRTHVYVRTFAFPDGLHSITSFFSSSFFNALKDHFTVPLKKKEVWTYQFKHVQLELVENEADGVQAIKQ